MTQHGKDFPNRVGNTTTRRLSLKEVAVPLKITIGPCFGFLLSTNPKSQK